MNATILPLLFISGIFFPAGPDAPQWIETLSDIFPVRHLVDAFLGSFYGPPLFAFSWVDVGVVAAWGARRAVPRDALLLVGAAQVKPPVTATP